MKESNARALKLKYYHIPYTQAATCHLCRISLHLSLHYGAFWNERKRENEIKRPNFCS